MSVYNVQREGPFTFVAGEDLAANSLVKLTTGLEVVYADAGDTPIGIVYFAASDGDTVCVEELRGIVQCKSGGNITALDFVKGANDGEVVAETVGGTATTYTLGIALETVADGDDVHVLPVHPIHADLVV